MYQSPGTPTPVIAITLTATLIALLLVACGSLPGATPTPYIVEVTATPPPIPSRLPLTPTYVPQAAPTSSPFPTPPPLLDNRLINPGFEGQARAIGGADVLVLEGWEPFYCAEPFTSEACWTRGRDEEGDFTAVMSRPQYAPTGERVRSGESAQRWWCGFATCLGGVSQTFPTAPGELCEVGAWVQSWSSPSDEGHDASGIPTGPFTSELAGQSDRDNSTWRIRVDPSGGTYPWRSGVLTSRVFGYSHGIYDQYALIRFSFVATGDRATVFFENHRLWPFMHNENFIDDAYAICWTPDEPPDTGPQIAFPVATGDATIEVGAFRPLGGGFGPATDPDAWDSDFISTGDVIRVGDEFWMYYTGGGRRSEIGLAISSDGVRWTRAGDGPVLEPGPRGSWDSGGVSNPAVIYDPESGQFEMWYAGNVPSGDVYRVGFGYATSPDGIHWTRASDGPVITVGPLGMWNEERIGPLDVVKVNDVYVLYYTATTLLPTFRRQIGCEASPDGVNWVECPGNPVFLPQPEIAPFEGIEVEWPSLVVSDGLWLMAYTGFLGEQGARFRIGLARSGDGLTWERLSDKPVIGNGTTDSAGEFSTSGPMIYLDREAGRLWLWYKDEVAGRIVGAVAPVSLP